MTNYIYLFLTLFLLAAGLTAMTQREFNLGFGRPKPIFYITLRETPAYINGVVEVVTGMILLGIFVVNALGWITIDDYTMQFILIFGMFVAGVSFVFALVIQSAMRVGEALQAKEKRKRKIDDDYRESHE